MSDKPRPEDLFDILRFHSSATVTAEREPHDPHAVAGWSYLLSRPNDFGVASAGSRTPQISKLNAL